MTVREKPDIRAMIECDETRTIILPTGRESKACVDSLRNEYDIDVPEFPEDLDVILAAGKWWRRMKGKDSPVRVSEGSADLAFAPTDVLRNLDDETLRRLQYARMSEVAMGEVCLLGAKSELSDLVQQLYNFSGKPLTATTKLPLMLVRCADEQQLNVVPSRYVISGSEEASVGWLAPMTAAVVETGRSAEAHGVDIVKSLEKIYPAAVWRVPAGDQL